MNSVNSLKFRLNRDDRAQIKDGHIFIMGRVDKALHAPLRRQMHMDRTKYFMTYHDLSKSIDVFLWRCGGCEGPWISSRHGWTGVVVDERDCRESFSAEL